MQIRQRLAENALGLAGSLADRIGPQTARHIGRAGARFTSALLSREFRIEEAQLEFLKHSVPSLRGISASEFHREVFYHIGESLAELLSIDKLLRSNDPANSLYPGMLCIEPGSSEELFRQAAIECQQGKSNLTLSGHIGNFELLGAYHASSGLPTTIIGRESSSSAINGWLHALRTKHGGESLVRRENSSNRKLSVDLIRTLKSGKSLGVFLDQDTKIESQFVPFFGLDASYITGPVSLAVRCRVKVLTTFIVRIGPLKHRISSAEIHYDPDSPTATADIIREYSRRLEGLLAEYPFQYPWFHRRWRRRPNIDYAPGRVRPLCTDEYVKWIRNQRPDRRQPALKL